MSDEGEQPQGDGEPQGEPEPKGEPEPHGGGKPEGGEKPRGRPEYKVYRSRRRFSDRFRRSELGSPEGKADTKEPSAGGPTYTRYRAGGGGLGDRFRSGRKGPGRGTPKTARAGTGGTHPWWKWALLAAGVWVLISFIAFAISAQIQKSKLSSQAKDALAGGPDLLAGQNILVLGGDQRGKKVGSDEPGASLTAPPRADTIMVVHAALTSFRKLSIPRDTYADIPGFGSNKINAAFSITGKEKGDAALMIRTVANFLGIDVNHLIIVDFDGFVDFINALGGVEVDLHRRVCGEVSGGKSNGGVTIHLKAGHHTLQAQKALALARIRKNSCVPSESDVERAQRQQLILNGVKDRLTDPLRFPLNFIKGPIIGWTAPKALISDMGALTLPQLVIASVFGGSGNPNVLKPSGLGPGGSLIISDAECARAVDRLLGGPPPNAPACSP